MIAAGLVYRVFAFAALCCGPSVLAFAEEANCDQIASMSRIARAQSGVALADRKAAGDSYRAQVVFASRTFEIHSTDRPSAIRLLDLIPKNDAQETTWITFGDSLCDDESLSDMKVLGQLGRNLSRDLARAVLLVPNRMEQYVSFSIVSARDPESDYAVHMRTVCETRKKVFSHAVNALGPDQRAWFVKHVLDPAGCRVSALPEAH